MLPSLPSELTDSLEVPSIHHLMLILELRTIRADDTRQQDWRGKIRFPTPFHPHRKDQPKA